jgi:predicted nucleotidyltransferase
MPAHDAADLLLTASQRAELADLLRRHVPQAEVWAYGSRVNGGAHEGSDLDLVLRHPDDETCRIHALDAAREALQDSALPILVELHDWADLPASFRREIEARHIVIQRAQRTIGGGD